MQLMGLPLVLLQEAAYDHAIERETLNADERKAIAALSASGFVTLDDTYRPGCYDVTYDGIQALNDLRRRNPLASPNVHYDVFPHHLQPTPPDVIAAMLRDEDDEAA